MCFEKFNYSTLITIIIITNPHLFFTFKYINNCSLMYDSIKN